MKMFKKIMAVALTAVMAVSMLTGCAFTDKLKNDHVLDAMSDVASTYAKRDETSTVDTVKFESKTSLNTELKNLLKDAKAEDVEKYENGKVVTVNNNKYIVTAVEIEKSTSSVSEFKNYAREILAGLNQTGVKAKTEMSNNGKTATVKAGVKVDGFKTADSKTVYYAVVLVEAVAKV
jgi:outer membrane lipoprotein-sorting protein